MFQFYLILTDLIKERYFWLSMKQFEYGRGSIQVVRKNTFGVRGLMFDQIWFKKDQLWFQMFFVYLETLSLVYESWSIVDKGWLVLLSSAIKSELFSISQSFHCCTKLQIGGQLG